MNQNDSVKMVGELKIVVRDESTGTVTKEVTVPNLVVTTGKNFIAASMLKTTTNMPAAMTHMAIGSGTVAAAAGDTVLGNQLARVALTSSTVMNNVVTYTASFPAGTGTGPVTEAGIFNDPSVGTMLCRTVFAVVNKGALDSITITWNVTIV